MTKEQRNSYNEALSRIQKARKQNATTLYLSGLGLSRLPDEISYLTQLNDLSIFDNQLTALPKTIGSLIQLKSLSITNNKLTALPNTIGNLTQLISLSISNNLLTELPDTIGNLTHLTYLYSSNNKLTSLPDVIGNLTRLTYLSIYDNKLTALPDAMRNLTQLTSLYISNNQLTELPNAIGNLNQLTSLYISNNQLTELPNAIGNLNQLTSLYISNNQLTRLPDTIGNLTMLQDLRISNNKLTVLPDLIGNLTQLIYFYIYNNKLTTLPKSILNLKSVNELFLHHNYELGLPAEVIGPTIDECIISNVKPAKPKDILNYYFRTRGGKKPLNEGKLILVGRGGVGKTSLVNRLLHNTFSKNETKTEGINITVWNLRLNGNEDIRMNIWDFGGQEIMHATHQFFLTQRSLYLLVLNGREGREDVDAEYWLKLIGSFGAGSPIIVVLNKINEHAFDLNRWGLQQKYQIREFIKTDCDDGTGITELQKAIERETDRLEGLRDAFPASWFEIKEKLATMKETGKNYMSFNDYRSFCSKHGEEEKEAQELLSVYLHNLGIALNYKDDPRLQYSQVLNPHWVTNGIYKVLNSKKLENQKGEIHINDVETILDGEDYPLDMRFYLFNLMKKFELCFSFPHDECCYLIPELLEKEEPRTTADFKLDECLNFQYYYPVLPEGLLPRFIVRTHILSEGLSRWRTGVILNFEGCTGLVKADIQERKVFISINGTGDARRRLLAVIRSDLERIHSDIKNLQPQEMVPLPGNPKEVLSYKELLVLEKEGETEIKKVIGNKVVNLNVLELLNGVDLEGTRTKEEARETKIDAKKLFYSYSHKDESFRNELEVHLKLLQRQGLIETWHDRKIEAGNEWKQKIDEHLETADLILLLISADFIASDYCYEIEMRRALEKHNLKEARIIPVIIRDVNWKNAPFAKLKALPTDGKAVTRWTNRDTAWRNVSEGIEKVVKEMQEKHNK